MAREQDDTVHRWNKRGARLVVVDPRRSETAARADERGFDGRRPLGRRRHAAVGQAPSVERLDAHPVLLGDFEDGVHVRRVPVQMHGDDRLRPGRDARRGGVGIEAIWPGSPAEKMGVKEGDVLVQLVHNRTESVADFQKVKD